MKRYKLTDGQWNKIKPYFEHKKGRPYKNLRATINGIIWVLRTGAMWRDLPSRYGILKLYRRTATRFDKLSYRFPAFIHIACILIWVKVIIQHALDKLIADMDKT